MPQNAKSFGNAFGSDCAGELAFGDAVNGVEFGARVENRSCGIATNGGFDGGGVGRCA